MPFVQAFEGTPIEIWGPFFLLVIVIVWVAGFVIGFQLSLTILTLMGFLAAIIGLGVPALGLLGIGLLATLDALTRTYLLSGGLLRWNTLNYLLLVVMALNLPFLLRLNNPLVRVLQVFILLLTLELYISPEISQGMQDVLNIATMFGLLVYFARAIEDERNLFWLGLVSGGAAAMGGLVFYLQSEALPYINPNAWGFFPFTGMVSVCLAYHYQNKFSRSRLILLLLAAINAVWIIFSGSRGTILMAVVCLVYLFLASRNFTWKAAMLFVSALVLIWFSAQFVEQQAYALSRLNKSFDPNASLAERTSGRSEIARAGLEVFSRNPFGVGTGGFEASTGQVDFLNNNGRPAHSAWIKVLVENGIPGVVLLSAFILSFSLAGLRRRQEGLFLVGLLVTLVFVVTFISKEYQGKSLWFLAAGATTLLYREEVLKALVAAKSRLPQSVRRNNVGAVRGRQR